MLDDTKGSTSEFYNIIKGSSSKTLPETMTYKGAQITGNRRYECFSDFLGSTFLTDIPDFGCSNIDVDENLLHHYHIHFENTYDYLWNNFSLKTTTSEITQYIKDLKLNKDPGPMRITASFLQHNIDKIVPMLTDAINTVFQTGRIPTDWKTNFIIPIPKKGSTADIENYRGIAIQSCIPKIFDRILTRMLYDSIGPIIDSSQHGFMKGKSTTTNLLEITQFLHENSKNQVDVIYFDFSKAFDKVRHDLLATKLCKLSIPFNFFKVLMKFIIGREYLLKINNTITEYRIFPLSSVPQGSHVGPILFVIFTNKMGIPNILCYADDTKIYAKISSMDDRNILQHNIRSLEEWAINNGLTLNQGKTYHMSYGKQVIDSVYFLQGKIIKKQSEVRDLGVIFDSQLDFKLHISSITRRLNQMTGAARRFCNGIKSPITICRIYKIYMQPIIDYASQVWNQNRIGINNQINTIVKRITRYALNISYKTHPSNYICYELRCHILNITLPEHRRQKQAAILGIKIIKQETRTSLRDTIMPFLAENPIRNRIFRPFYVINQKSPIFFLMNNIKLYEQHIKINEATSTTKLKIDKANELTRSIAAENMQRRSRNLSILNQRTLIVGEPH